MSEVQTVPRALVVCARRYNGHELWTALGVMQQAGVEFEVISKECHIEDEVTGEENTVARTIWDVEPDEIISSWDGLMFVSGNMKDTEEYWHLPRTLDFVEAAAYSGAQIAAICCSVPTIRGAAKGRRVSFFPLVRSRELLRRSGAILCTVAVTCDQTDIDVAVSSLTTAEHQMGTQMWANAFVRCLFWKPVELGLRDSGYVPRGRRRKPPKELQLGLG